MQQNSQLEDQSPRGDTSNRSRSRSPPPGGGAGAVAGAGAGAFSSEGPQRTAAAAAGGGSSAGQVKAMSAAMLEAALSAGVREKLGRILEDGSDKSGQISRHFDAESLTSLHSLPEHLQEKVIWYLEEYRIYLINSRSRSGFLVATCERARQGSLDARGLGVADPWRYHLLAIATPKRAGIELVPEKEWLQQHGPVPASIIIDVQADEECARDLRVPSVTVAVFLGQTVAALKQKLIMLGVRMPVNKIRLREFTLGFLKDDRTLAFYNLKSGSALHVIGRERAGRALTLKREARAAKATEEGGGRVGPTDGPTRWN